MEKTQAISWSIATVLIVAMICSAFAYGCTTTNRQYYSAMSECVQAGGSVVPTNASGGATIICIRK